MITDSGGKGAVLAYPVARSNSRIEEEQNSVDYLIALKTHFGRDYTLLAWSIIYRARVCGGKLYAVFEIKNHTVYGVRVALVSHAIEHDVAHRDFSLKDLSTCLGFNNSGEPIKLVRVVIAFGILECPASPFKLYGARFIIPINVELQRSCEGSYRNIKRIVYILYFTYAVKISSVDGYVALARGNCDSCASKAYGCGAGFVIVAYCAVSHAFRDFSQGNIC